MIQVNLEDVIRESLGKISKFQTEEGLFKTFRSDFSGDPTGFIDENNAIFIDTKYDHAVALEILIRLNGYFANRAEFLDTVSKGLKLVEDDCVLNEQALQWRFYNIEHNNSLIPTDIDDTGKCLRLIETAKEILGEVFVSENILIDTENIHNYKQYELLLRPLDKNFRPGSGTGYFGLVTYFGDKERNDVDPVCNIEALHATLYFLNRNLHHANDIDFDYTSKIMDYLSGFMKSYFVTQAHEYYEPPVLFYNFAKLLETCEKLAPEIRKNITLHSDIRDSVIGLILERINSAGWKNALEAAFLTTALISMGYKGHETDQGLNYILDAQNPDRSWDAYEFYRQRHPHRIFGSKGLTTMACLESLHYSIENITKSRKKLYLTN